jgi:hypothetical protein
MHPKAAACLALGFIGGAATVGASIVSVTVSAEAYAVKILGGGAIFACAAIWLVVRE